MLGTGEALKITLLKQRAYIFDYHVEIVHLLLRVDLLDNNLVYLTE